MRRLLLPALLLISATAMATSSHHHGNRTISFDDFDNAAADCSAMRVKFDGDRVPVVTENVPVGNLRSLRVRSDQNGGIRVIGSRTGGYAVTACKAAALTSDVSQVRVSINGNEVSATGPDSDDWVVYFIVQTPRNATLDVQSTNGPIGIYEFDGTLTARAQNGPLGMKDSSGTIDRVDGQRPDLDRRRQRQREADGDQRTAVRQARRLLLGRRSRRVDAERSGLAEAPARLSLRRRGRIARPRPVSCRAEGCAAVARLRQTDDFDDDDRPRRIELGSGPAAVHLSTVNGPVSVKDLD